MDWINGITLHLAHATKIDVAELTVDAEQKDALLVLAGVAAHTSGDRTNAPLLCHVIGRAMARGASLEECTTAVREFAGPH